MNLPIFQREPIYAAIFSFWAGLTLPTLTVPVPAFKSATRNLKHWDDVSGEDSPALLVQQRREVSVYRKGLPLRWTFELALFVYVRTNGQNDPTVLVTSVLNPLLDAIEGALLVDDITTNSCTLGGIVSSCAINGPIEIFQGNLGDEEVAIIPISIVPNH